MTSSSFQEVFLLNNDHYQTGELRYNEKSTNDFLKKWRVHVILFL